MEIKISIRSGEHIYEQIKEQIKKKIFSGELAEDELLPSIRGLAQKLKISVVPILQAYSDLENEKFIVRVQGKGCYVLPINKELAKENALHKINNALLSVIKVAKIEKINKSQILEKLNLMWEHNNK
jgi:GntR family transcriptional regulator